MSQQQTSNDSAEFQWVPAANRCRVPGCKNDREGNPKLCPECVYLGYDADYERYESFLYEGMSAHQARQMAGF